MRKILIDVKNGVIVATGTKNINEAKSMNRRIEMDSRDENTSKKEILEKLASLFSVKTVDAQTYRAIKNGEEEFVYEKTGYRLQY